MERMHYQPDKPDPRIRLEVEGHQVEVGRDEATRFTFLGELAIYNHVFLHKPNILGDDSGVNGLYIFKLAPTYKRIDTFMFDNDFPAVINQTEVPECDQQAFDTAIKQEFTNFNEVPDDWQKPNTGHPSGGKPRK